MIVNHTPDGWQIVYQQAHGLLATQLGWHWQPFGPTERWVGLLAAIAQHDDEQPDWNGHYGLTPAGAPANFTMQEFSLEQATGVMRAARFQGRWRSLLTSLHMSTLYEELRGQNKQTDAFLDEQLALQKRWMKELHLSRKETYRYYDLLHWCDRLSLILCRQELPEMGRSLEIYTGQDGQRYDVTRPEPDGPITVQPWPFLANSFTVSVEVSLLKQLQFKNDAELAAALREAPVTLVAWEFRK